MNISRKRLPVSVSSAVFIENKEGHLLLLKQASIEKSGKWGPPAGGMEAHEDPRATAIREAKEEIGVDVELIDLIGIYTVDRGPQRSGLAFVFRGRIISGEIEIDESEISDYRYFSPDEITKLTEGELLYKPEYNKVNVQDWLAGKSYPLDVINCM